MRWSRSVYLSFPALLVSMFEGDREPGEFAAVAAIVPKLLVCVAIYSLADAVNLTFSFALRGAGDTRFVSLLTFALAWPIMVMPTYVVVQVGGSVYWAWVLRDGAHHRDGGLLLSAVPHAASGRRCA